MDHKVLCKRKIFLIDSHQYFPDPIVKLTFYEDNLYKDDPQRQRVSQRLMLKFIAILKDANIIGRMPTYATHHHCNIYSIHIIIRSLRIFQHIFQGSFTTIVACGCPSHPLDTRKYFPHIKVDEGKLLRYRTFISSNYKTFVSNYLKKI